MSDTVIIVIVVCLTLIILAYLGNNSDGGWRE